MPKELPGGSLQNLFVTDVWQDCFSALSESLGFSLSIFSRDGKMLYCPRNTAPFCSRFRSSVPSLVASCETHCRPFLENAIHTEKTNVFKCYLKVVSFVVPIRHRGEHAVILGQGSFSSLTDFYESRRHLLNAGVDVASLTAPTVFTSYPNAWMVCDFTADAVGKLLHNDRADNVLAHDIDSMKKFVVGWSAPTGEQPEVLYHYLLKELSLTMTTDRSTVLLRDRKEHKFTDLDRTVCVTKITGLDLSEESEIVQNILDGAPFMFPADSPAAAAAGFLKNEGYIYFFPIIVHGQLEGILCIAGREIEINNMQIIAALCRQTALSIENNQLRQDLFHKFDRFVALTELTKAITPIQNYRMLLRKILDESAELLRAEQGSLMLIDHETEDLLVSAKKGIVEGVAEQFRIRRGEGIAGRVAEFGEALLVKDLEHDQRFMQKNKGHYKTRSFVSIPLKINDRVIGVLNLSDKTTGEVFNEEDLELAQAFATHAAIVMDRNRSLHKSEELEKLSITDYLTGLANRRYLFDRLKKELTRSERYGHHLTLLMLDLDGFKQCNDTRGHQFGDKVLKDLALIIINTIRSIDIASRYGGDEFIIILPETDEALARDIAERIRGKVEERLGGSSNNGDLQKQEPITISIGVACYPEHGVTLEHLLKNVDTAMYDAKKAGKNRIAVFQGNNA